MAVPAPPVPVPAPGPDLRLRRAEIGWIVAFWLFLACLSAANRVLDPRGPGLQGVIQTGPVLLVFFESALWAALTPPLFALAARTGTTNAGTTNAGTTNAGTAGAGTLRAGRVVLVVAVAVLLAVAVDVVVDLFRYHALGWTRRPVSLWLAVTRLWFINDLVSTLGVLAAGLARAYFLRYQVRQAEAVRLEAHAARLERQLAEARLAALRMQLDPHFLFNTLHAVSSLVERDPRGVRRMISRLSELLRHSLEGGRETEVPLERELEFLRRYLEIMEVRFQGRLHVGVTAAPEVMGARVPNLILQPLVENAVKHGADRADGATCVQVTAAREGERLLLRVRDTGPGPRAGAREGVGMANTRERLRQMYGDEARLELRPDPEGGAVAEIEIPFLTGADLRAVAVGAR